jgi:hypothetical protein
MRYFFALALATSLAGCSSCSTDAEEFKEQAAQKTKAPPKGAKTNKSKTKTPPDAKAKAKAKAQAKAKAKAKAKASQPSKPPPEYGVEGDIQGELLLTAEDLEDGKKRTKAELAIRWEGSEGVEAGEDKVLLGHAPGSCKATPPTPFTENETEITPLWSATCTHEKATALVVLYQAGNLLLLKRSVLGAEDKPGPWKPIKKVRFAKGAQLVP